MATKQATNTVLRRFGYTSIEFYRNNMQKVTDFGRCEVTSFHFEEGISHPYTGILNLITQNAVDFGKLDLTYLYVKISYQINYVYEQEPEEYNTGDTRTVWALIKTVTNLPKVEKVNPYNTDEKFYYQYQLTLESPLARLNNKQTIFSELKISQILSELLNRGDSKDGKESTGLYNPLLCEIDVSRIQNLAQLDTRTLKIQRGQEKNLSFFNRILIAYGINYVLDFDEQKGVKIIFSCDQDYKKKSALNCTNDLNIASKDINYIYLANATLKKNSIQFDEARVSAKSLKNSWLDIEADRADTSGLKSSQIKLFYKNLCIRYLAINPKLSAQSVQDIRLEPGLILNSNIDDITSKYVVENLITDITTIFKDKSKENTVQIKNDCLELVDHPAFVELDDKSDGDYFEFDSKRELGCLVHQEVDSLESLDPKQSIDIIEAKACAKDGSINSTLYADYADDGAENNDLFYALIANNNADLLIKVHTLIEADCSNVKKVMQGQRILVLQKGGTYYLYGYVPQPIDVDKDKWDGINQEIMNLKNESSISLQNYKTNNEYIYALLKNSPKHVENAVIVNALEINDASVHDLTYVDKYHKQVVEQNKKFLSAREKYETALDVLNDKYGDGKLSLSSYYKDNKLIDSAPQELKDVNTCKTAYTEVCENLFKLAKNIVTDCKINFIKDDPKNIISFDNKDGFEFNAADGSFVINASNITLNATSKISLNAEDIDISATSSVKSHVGLTAVTTTKESTKISTGTTINGTIPDEKGNNTSDLLSSSLTVGTFGGISGSAYCIKLTGNNKLDIKGPLGSGISLGYGSVKVTGAEFKVSTIGKIEQVKNIAVASKTMLFDIIQSCGSLKNNYTTKCFSAFFDTVSNAYDIGTGVINKYHSTLKPFKKDDSTYFDYIDSIIQAIFSLLDYSFMICKSILSAQEIRYNHYVNDKKETSFEKYQLMTPFNKQDQNKRLDQVQLYISHAKMVWSLIAATVSAVGGKPAASGIVPSVSTLSINSTKSEIKSQKISFTVSDDIVSACSPAAGYAEYVLKKKKTGGSVADLGIEQSMK